MTDGRDSYIICRKTCIWRVSHLASLIGKFMTNGGGSLYSALYNHPASDRDANPLARLGYYIQILPCYPIKPIPTPISFIKIVSLSSSFFDYHLHLSFTPIRPEKYSTVSAFKEHNSKRDQRSHFFYS
ncbi:hypothetical protein I7I48_04606 [Histoplasma ohiense]|nr:hypothetical protein I7I48_04606 [Histoplasma ohiense (nom. inval.)]